MTPHRGGGSNDPMNARRRGLFEVGTLMTVLVGVLLACSGGAKANVDCQPAAGGAEVHCNVTHVEGTAQAHVCWDLHYDCEGGGSVSGTGYCVDVAPSKTEKKVIQYASLTGKEACKGVKARLENLKVSAK